MKSFIEKQLTIAPGLAFFLFIIFAAIVGHLVYWLNQPSLYRSQAVLVSPPSQQLSVPAAFRFWNNTSRLQAYQKLLNPELFSKLAQHPDLVVYQTQSSPQVFTEELLKSTSLKSYPESFTVSIVVHHENPLLSRSLANAVAHLFLKERPLGTPLKLVRLADHPSLVSTALRKNTLGLTILGAFFLCLIIGAVWSLRDKELSRPLDTKVLFSEI